MAYEYQLTFVESDGKNFKQFIVPIRIGDSTSFGLIDTGASVTTLSYEVAFEMGLNPGVREPDGEATFVGGFPYYYSTMEIDIQVLKPEENLLDDMWAILSEPILKIEDYYDDLTPALTVNDVPTRILTKPMSEFAKEADWSHPDLQSRTKAMPPVAILGVYGFIDKIMVKTNGPEVFFLDDL